MIWLLGLVLIIQAGFYWFLKPAILLTTPVVELRGLLFVFLIIAAWLVSGRSQGNGSS